MFEATNQEEITDIAKGLLLTSRVIMGLCRQNQSVMEIDDVSSVDLHICHVVKQRGSASLSEIAKCLKVSQAYASGAVDGLVARKLLVRERDRNNRRKCIISIAPDATQRIECMEAEILLPICTLVKKIGKAEARSWIDLFRQIEKEMEVPEA
ncbi:MarR family transcriptional regulator [uncultured Desulfosarcina sp.]|uniref:MarR family winged helix-turn-helix transcriptional regulator n=1 Tax=uncultured Desulfosarcina sp. TaxID=218289 RepID=UPI0029C77E35|nr:MarR family transcriptional regulator [uncultured Desulfosarcina sp.]